MASPAPHASSASVWRGGLAGQHAQRLPRGHDHSLDWLVAVGSRTCSPDPAWQFLSTAHVADRVREVILRAHLYAVDIEPLKVEFPVEFGLSMSVEAGGRKLETLWLPEPTTLDLCWKHGNEITPEIHLLASLTERAPDEVRVLKAADFARASELAAAFL